MHARTHTQIHTHAIHRTLTGFDDLFSTLVRISNAALNIMT